MRPDNLIVLLKLVIKMHIRFYLNKINLITLLKVRARQSTLDNFNQIDTMIAYWSTDIPCCFLLNHYALLRVVRTSRVCNIEWVYTSKIIIIIIVVGRSL